MAEYDKCGYTHDTSNENIFDDIDDDIWSCQHPSETDSEYCLFHRPTSEKSDRGVVERFLEVVNTGYDEMEIAPKERLRFIGAKFGDLDLEKNIISSQDNYSVDLRFVTVDGTLKLGDAIIRQNWNLTHAKIGAIDATKLKVNADFHMDHITVESTTSFINATFDGLVYAREATFKNEIKFSEALFRDSSFMNHAKFLEKADFFRSNFDKVAAFRHAVFEKQTSFAKVVFKSEARFHNVEFRSEAEMKGVSFHKTRFVEDTSFNNATFCDAKFTDTDFANDVNFEDATFSGWAQFENATLEATSNFMGTEFGDWNPAVDRTEELSETGSVQSGLELEHTRHTPKQETSIREEQDVFSFSSAIFKGRALFKDATFNDQGGIYNGQVTFAGAKFSGEELYFPGATFECEATFSDVKFDCVADFRNTDFRLGSDFKRAEFSTLRIQQPLRDPDSHVTIDMSDASINTGEISQPYSGSAIYEFRGATIGNVDLKVVPTLVPTETNSDEVDSDSNSVQEPATPIAHQQDMKEYEEDPDLFSYFLFKETDFEGFDFNQYRQYLAPEWKIHTTTTNRWTFTQEELEATYLKAKNGASLIGDSLAHSEFYRAEMRHRRKQHFRQFRENSKGFSARIKAGGNWTANALLALTTGYGERPRNVVLSSALIVLLYTGIYRVLGALPAGASLAEYLLFSLQNFVTFIIGTRPQGTLSVRYASASEAFLGAFFVALFVFTLTRSLNR